MNDIKKATNEILRHGKILWKGLKRTVYGALTAGLFAMAGYGLTMIPTEGGYLAVCDFIGAIAILVVAVTCVYHQGGGKRKRGGFEK